MHRESREYFVHRRQKFGMPTVDVVDHTFVAEKEGDTADGGSAGEVGEGDERRFLLRIITRPRDHAAGVRRLLLFRLEGDSSTLVDAWQSAADEVDVRPRTEQTFSRVRWILNQEGYTDIKLDTSRDIDR